MGALENNSKNGVLVEHAMFTIQKFMSAEIPGALDHYYNANTIDHCIQAMSLHNGQIKTLDACQSIIQHITHCPSLRDDTEKTPILLKTVAAVMRQCTQEANIMCNGLKIIGTLLDRVPCAKQHILTGALDVLVSCMREYPVGHESGIATDVQVGAIDIIAQFQFDEDNIGTTFMDFMNIIESGMRSFRSKTSFMV